MKIIKKEKQSYQLISIAGAVFHNLGQIVFYYFMAKLPLKSVIPVGIIGVISGIIMGVITGSITERVVPALKKNQYLIKYLDMPYISMIE